MGSSTDSSCSPYSHKTTASIAAATITSISVNTSSTIDNTSTTDYSSTKASNAVGLLSISKRHRHRAQLWSGRSYRESRIRWGIWRRIGLRQFLCIWWRRNGFGFYGFDYGKFWRIWLRQIGRIIFGDLFSGVGTKTCSDPLKWDESKNYPSNWFSDKSSWAKISTDYHQEYST